jgi:hypothetical protein
MTCIFCGKPVTQSQLDSDQAVKVGRDKHAHLGCIGRHQAGEPVKGGK